jgi:hypothetical protein
MREVLADHGFTQVEGGVPQSFVLADATGHEIDAHPVTFDDRGDGHLLSEDGTPFGHPAEAFPASPGCSPRWRTGRLRRRLHLWDRQEDRWQDPGRNGAAALAVG